MKGQIRESDKQFGDAAGVRLLARLYQPAESAHRGIVMVHGGAWTANDRETPYVMSRLLAARGLTVLSLDFRCGPEYQHPAASADIAAGIRYLRGHASELDIESERIALIGSSSGGHLALYTALQPNVERHMTTLVVGCNDEVIDASVCCVVALWPVSNPLARYDYAIRTGRKELIRAHDGYFGSRETMHEASIQRVLRSRTYTHLPPALIVQPGEDANVPQYMTNDLLMAFKGVRHKVEYLHLPGLPHAFAYEASENTNQCESEVWNFISPHLGVLR